MQAEEQDKHAIRRHIMLLRWYVVLCDYNVIGGKQAVEAGYLLGT